MKIESFSKYMSKIYKVGDYVILHYQDTICKILDINDNGLIIISDIIKDKMIESTINYVNIKRKASQEEIENFKMKTNINKFNI